MLSFSNASIVKIYRMVVKPCVRSTKVEPFCVCCITDAFYVQIASLVILLSILPWFTVLLFCVFFLHFSSVAFPFWSVNTFTQAAGIFVFIDLHFKFVQLTSFETMF